MTEFEPTLTSLRETADRLDEIMEVSSPWVHAKLTPMLRDAVDAIEGLERENARLWDELDAAKHDLSVFSGEFVATNTENAKLRKLAAEMYPYAKAFLKEGVMLGCVDSKSHDWFLQLRELGIEVDE